MMALGFHPHNHLRLLFNGRTHGMFLGMQVEIKRLQLHLPVMKLLDLRRSTLLTLIKTSESVLRYHTSHLENMS